MNISKFIYAVNKLIFTSKQSRVKSRKNDLTIQFERPQFIIPFQPGMDKVIKKYVIIVLFKSNCINFIIRNYISLKKMSNLTKSAVGASLVYKKSPDKYPIYETRPEDYGNLERSMQVSSRKQWNTSDYSGLRKVPDTIKDLRQTFDTKPSGKVQEALSKSSYTVGQSGFTNGGYDFSKFQYSTRTATSNYDAPSQSTYDKIYKKQSSNPVLAKYDKNVKSPMDKKIDIDEKFKFYVDAVEKFKEQADVTSKMSEQLKKLKEDRKKRLQAKEKEKQAEAWKAALEQKQKQRQKQSFKKKTSYQYYSPKEQKPIVIEKYGSDSKPTKLERFKSYNMVTEPSPKQELKRKASTKYDYVESKPITSTSTSVIPPSMPIKSKIQSSLFNGEIKDFILGKLLGEGKFGQVYQAWHKPTRSMFAIKKIPKEMIKSHLMVDQFCLQIKLQMFLNHQNILTLFHFFDDRTHIYLVLEYMDEGTLFSHLKKNRKLPEPEVAVKIKEIASAVKYLHENQIAHRDIKPENIVMTHGVCKLCDFGWATVCDERRKTYCGTFDYAPPEILAGAEYDYTVDLWCLGVLTYELLVGKAPFYHISRKQTMKKILNVQKTVLEYPQGISKDAISFMDNLIKKDPKQRISSEQILQHPFLKYAPTKGKLDFKK